MSERDPQKPAPVPRGRVRALSVAPMMDRTDRHFRYLFRLLSRHSLLYTEMITVGAILHGPRDRLLKFHPDEHPLSLQLGGDDPAGLAECARIAEDRGYDEVNLNVGCPSDRVQKGRFGAALMAEPERVAAAVDAMRAAVSLPVTVKHRIGIDDLDTYEHMLRFVDVVAEAGCDRFSVHARKAWLQGLSPKENREVPPLRYGEVHRLKAERPELKIEINGGILDLDQVEEHLRPADGSTPVDAVMVGRAAYARPYDFAAADRRLFDPEAKVPTPREVAEGMIAYAAERLAEGDELKHITRHILNLFVGRPGARAWRRTLSQNAHRPGAGIEVMRQALRPIPDEVLDHAGPAGGKPAGGRPETGKPETGNNEPADLPEKPAFA